MDKKLKNALKQIHNPLDWVHFSSIGPDGGPHVTPLMMGIHEQGLLFSFTGKQKKRNLERDPRACVSICKAIEMDHIIVWGTVDIRHDEEAHDMWNEMILLAFGEERLQTMKRVLSIDKTSLGVLKPSHYRIYGLEQSS